VVAEARENTAMNINKHADKNSLTRPTPAHGIRKIFLAIFLHVIIQLFSANFLSGLAVIAFLK